jgi:hypothetical protein
MWMRQEDYEFEANLDLKEDPFLKKKIVVTGKRDSKCGKALI